MIWTFDKNISECAQILVSGGKFMSFGMKVTLFSNKIASNLAVLPSILTLTAKGTLFSPTALNSALKWINQSIRWETTISCRFLKSRISAKINGPEKKN